MIYVDLIFNLSLLVALSVVSGFINQRWPRNTRIGALMQGFLFGSAAVIGMLRPFVLAHGLIFDGRSVMLSLCAWFFGPWSALIAAPMTIACRIGLGGGGWITGVLVILTSVGIGLWFHSHRKTYMNPPSTGTLYLFGIIVHIAMLLMMLAMPAGSVLMVLKNISLPVMLLYPLATILVGKILSDQEVNSRYVENLRAQRDLLEIEITERKQAQEASRKTEEIFSLFMQNSPIYVFFKDAQIRSLRLSSNYEKMLGKPMHELLGKTMDELFPSEFAKKMVTDDLRIIKEGKEADIEEEFNGRYYSTIKFPIFQDGKPQYLAGYTIDITERKRAEEALQESEMKFRKLLESTPLPITYVNKEGAITFRNERFIKVFGYTNEDVPTLNEWWLNAYPDPKYRQWVIQNWNSAIRCAIDTGSDIKSAEYHVTCKDGTVREVIISGIMVSDSYLVTLIDITKRKRAEEALQESERRLSEAQKMAQFGHWIWDIKTGNVEWSDEIYNIFQLDPKEFTPHIDSILALSPWPEDHQRGKELIEKAMASHEKGSYEQRFLRPDNSIGYYCSSFQGKYDAEGNLQLILGTIQDITERKKTEEALRFSSKRLNFITQITGSVVGSGTIHDVAKYLTSQVRECFEVDACIIRILEDDNLHLLASDGIPEEQLNVSLPVYGLAEKILSTRKPLSIFDVRIDPMAQDIPDPTAKTFPFVSFAGIPLIAQDEIVGILGLYTSQEPREFTPVDIEHLQIVGSHVAIILSNERLFDRVKSQRDQLETNIAERKMMEQEKQKLQDQLAQAQKMESIGRLAGGVAHDFNNMLQTILGYSEMSMLEVSPDNPLRENLLEIQKAGQRSAELTRQLLAFARKQTISPIIMDLNDEVAGMLKMLTRLIGEDIDLIWNPRTAPGLIKMDPSQIDQILVNLTLNARDSIEGVGRITIETDMADFDESYCSNHVGFILGRYTMLAVSDNGCGMDEATIEHIFEPFFTTKRMGKGTGLGLATVYGIVKQNNGYINVYSEPGEGTTFKIYFPAQGSESVKVKETFNPAEPLGGTETVLLVEDDESLLQLAKQMLEKLGYTVMATSSSKKAIEISNEYNNTIHLLMTDVVMPEMSGRDLWSVISQQRNDTKCLYMSGYTKNVIAHQGILEEGIHFIQKPFSMDALALKIHEVLNTHK